MLPENTKHDLMVLLEATEAHLSLIRRVTKSSRGYDCYARQLKTPERDLIVETLENITFYLDYIRENSRKAIEACVAQLRRDPGENHPDGTEKPRHFIFVDGHAREVSLAEAAANSGMSVPEYLAAEAVSSDKQIRNYEEAPRLPDPRDDATDEDFRDEDYDEE